MNEIMIYSFANEPYDLACEEFNSDNESDDELSMVSYVYEEDDILEYECSNIETDMIDDMKDADRLGMTLEELYKMYDEINNFQEDIRDYAPEWPFDRSGGYQDEGIEECT